MHIVPIFIIWKLLVYWFSVLGIILLPFLPTFTLVKDYLYRLPYLVWIFGNFDGMIYLSIAKDTYHSLENAFFPLYPFIVGVVDRILHYPPVIEAQLVSHLAFLIALFVIVKLLKFDKLPHLTDLVLLVIILFPTSMFYGAAYNDSLFLLFATLCIYFGRKKNFGLAGVWGALATLTRLNGLALLFFLLFEYLLQGKKMTQLNKHNLLESIKANIAFKKLAASQIYWALLIPLALLGYLLYTHITSGNWSMVFSNMKIWQQDQVTLPPQVVWRYFKILILNPTFELTYWVAALEVFFVGVYAFFLIYSFKKIRASYWVLFFLSILIPMLTGTFAGMPRYGLHVYPFFITIALFLSEKKLFFRIIYFAVSLILMLIIITLFTRGYFVT